MKKENIIKLVFCLVVIIAIAYVAIFGINISGRQIIKGAKSIKTGLDISGGVTIVYQAEPEENTEVSEADLSKSEAVIRKRLESKGIFDYIVRTDSATSQINIEIPTVVEDSSKDPLSAVEGLDKTAKIEFRDPDSNVLLSGSDIKGASYSEDAVDATGLPSPHVVLAFSEDGAQKFSEATAKLVGKAISIYLDETEIAAPIVNSQINSNTAIITMGQGSYSEKKAQAKEYSMLIDSGALPFNLSVVSKEYVGPYVGQEALNISIKSAIIALILVILFMIIIYKVLGLAASFSLTAYASIVLLIMSNLGISLTLSGIAGLILSIGMAVDANVIIFERFKEELKQQKISVKKGFEKSFKNAMAAIVDGNITTFIVAILLYIFGVSSVKGFGIILAIGVVVSLFTSVVITKFILKQIIDLANKNTFLFGIKKEGVDNAK